MVMTVPLHRAQLNKSAGTNDILLAAVFTVAAYVFCFIVLEVLRTAYEKRRQKLDETGEE